MPLFSRPRAIPTRIIGALLALTLLASCSAVRIGYNNLASVSYWWLDGFVDFDEAQTRQVRAELAMLHDWHRRSELPAYAALLDRMAALAGGPVSAAQVCQLAEQVRTHAQRLGERSAQGLAAVVPTLRPEQLRHMAEQFDKRDRKWRGEWLEVPAAEREERRLKQAVDRAETLYGRLDEQQRALLRQGLAASGFDARRSEAERLRRQQDILQTLKEHARGAQPVERSSHLAGEMLALVQRSIDPPDLAHRRYAAALLDGNCRLLAALHNSTSAEQRRHAVATLRDYEADAHALSAQR